MRSRWIYVPQTLSNCISGMILSDYSRDAFMDSTTCIYPEGSAIFCFSLDKPFLLKVAGASDVIRLSKFNFIPQFIQPRFYQVLLHPDKVLHIVFKPYGAYKLLGIPQNNFLQEHAISLLDMLAEKINSLLTQIEDAADNEAHITDLVYRWLECQLIKHEKIDISRVRNACQLIAAHQGQMPIHLLALNMHMSKRALEYQFLAQVGLSPKAYSRVTRFSFLRNAIADAKTVDWQALSFKLNYFDQAHLINDFKYFTGNSPTHFSTIRPILTTIV